MTGLFPLQVHDVLHFLPQSAPNVIDFIWMSEKSNHRHLYKVSTKLAQSGTQYGFSEGRSHLSLRPGNRFTEASRQNVKIRNHFQSL